MELRHLRYFIAVSHALSFTRAAALVHVTQSTLSHQIAQLEDELGVKLFVREGRSVRLTPDGEAFLGKAQKSLAILDEGIRTLRPQTVEDRVILRIGTTPSLASNLLVHATARMLRSRLVTHVQVQEGDPEELCGLLRRDALDLVLAYPPVVAVGLSSAELLDEEMMLVVGRAHPLATRPRIRLADLHNMDLVLPTHRFSMRDTIDGFFAVASTRPRIVAELDSLPGTLELVDLLGAAALLPATVTPAGDRWCRIAIERPFARRMITLYRKTGDSISPVLLAAIEAIRTASSGIGTTVVTRRRNPAPIDGIDRK